MGIPSGIDPLPNPIRAGYTRSVVSANVALLIREGRRHDVAVAIALDTARRYYRMRHPRGPYPHHLRENEAARYVANAPRVLPYGTLPPPRDFETVFMARVPDGKYHLDLHGADARAAVGTIFEAGNVRHYSAVEVYRGLGKLIDRWETGDDDNAAVLASSILASLGYEWA